MGVQTCCSRIDAADLQCFSFKTALSFEFLQKQFSFSSNSPLMSSHAQQLSNTLVFKRVHLQLYKKAISSEGMMFFYYYYLAQTERKMQDKYDLKASVYSLGFEI